MDVREYAPFAAVITALCLLVATVYVRFIAVDTQSIVIALEPAVAERLRHGEVEMELLHAYGEAQAVVTKWSTRPGKLVVHGFSGPTENVAYSYLVIYWSNGSATLHEIDVRFIDGVYKYRTA